MGAHHFVDTNDETSDGQPRNKKFDVILNTVSAELEIDHIPQAS
jgi:D-arabinose 1-dehydrogenase-like Zn-dependent alcohol dehydrogenase